MASITTAATVANTSTEIFTATEKCRIRVWVTVGTGAYLSFSQVTHLDPGQPFIGLGGSSATVPLELSMEGGQTLYAYSGEVTTVTVIAES